MSDLDPLTLSSFPSLENIIKGFIQCRLHTLLHKAQDFGLQNGLLLFLLFLLLFLGHRIFTSLVNLNLGKMSSSCALAALAYSRSRQFLYISSLASCICHATKVSSLGLGEKALRSIFVYSICRSNSSNLEYIVITPFSSGVKENRREMLTGAFSPPSEIYKNYSGCFNWICPFEGSRPE